MLEFLIDNIYIVVGEQVFQQSVGIPMGSNCTPLLVDLFCIHMRGNLFKTFEKKKKYLAVAFNSTIRYIDEVSSVNNSQFHSIVDSIYPNELEIKKPRDVLHLLCI
jgi:hypothetical protein